MKKAGVVAAICIFLLIILLLSLKGCGKSEGGVKVAPPSVSVESGSVSRGYDIGMLSIKDESLLDYSQPVISAKGTVTSKRSLLLGTQVVYLITITLDDLNSSSVSYFCTYQVYDSVDIRTRLNVSYQKLTESTFSVLSVTSE